MVICLQQGADLHMAQLMPLPLTVSCFSKIQIGFTFLVPAHPGSPRQRAVKRVCACVCVVVRVALKVGWTTLSPLVTAAVPRLAEMPIRSAVNAQLLMWPMTSRLPHHSGAATTAPASLPYKSPFTMQMTPTEKTRPKRRNPQVLHRMHPVSGAACSRREPGSLQ